MVKKKQLAREEAKNMSQDDAIDPPPGTIL